MDNLEDFLKGNAEQPEAVEETSAPEPTIEAEAPEVTVEEPKGPVRDEKGRFAPKGETVAEEPAPQVASPATQEPPLDHAALIGERRRRQEAEDRIRALEEQFAKLQQPSPQPEGPPDLWEDPEGYDRYLFEQAAMVAEERAMHAVQQQRIYESAIRARSKYADYDAAHATFGEMVQANPGLFQQMVSAVDPAEFAYTTAKTEMEIRQYGGLDKLVEARVQAALAAQTQPVPTPPSIPDTLADAQSARGNTPAFTVPSLNDILKR